MREEILELLEQICEDDIIYTDPNINLVEEGLMESLDFITLIVELSDTFDISISPAEFSREEMDTPNKIIEIVQNKLENE